MTVLVRFLQSGAFHAGEFLSIDLSRITRLQVSHQRNTCELVAHTPENLQPGIPYIIARRDHEYLLREILQDFQRLKTETRDIIYEITETEARQVSR